MSKSIIAEELARLATDCRRKQRDYFGRRNERKSHVRLQEAKDAERRLDRALAEFWDGRQGELFTDEG